MDLEVEELYDSCGNRITEDYVAEAVREVHAARRGRPSLSGGSKHSPRVSFRVPEGLQDRLMDVSTREGKSPSQVAREALERYLAAG